MYTSKFLKYTELMAAAALAGRAGTTATWDQLNKYFVLMPMPIVSSRYWNIVHGEVPGDVEQDVEGMQTMRFWGRNMMGAGKGDD